MTFLLSLTIIAITLTVILLSVFIIENKGILNDNLLEEYLNKISDNYRVYQSECFSRIEPKHLKKYIEKSEGINWLFPYYIEYVGVIPIWSKHKKRIDAMFSTAPKEDWKRKKLGLD
jgi:hypothetical protein